MNSITKEIEISKENEELVLKLIEKVKSGHKKIKKD
jgi:hypothetical protein